MKTQPKQTIKASCDCKDCKSACWRSCGWFGSIEEIEGAAKLMKMPLKKFIKEYLIQEWWTGEDEVSVPAPRKNFDRSKNESDLWGKSELFPLQEEKVKNGKGFIRATWGHNLMTGYACIFLDENEKCMIHKSKPLECKEGFACRKGNFKGRESLLKYWKKHQGWVHKWS